MVRWLAKLHNLDRRWLYLAAALVLCVGLSIRIAMPRGNVSRGTRGLYEAIESCPPGKIVLIDSSWDMGSQAENWAQFECVVRHLCEKRIRFVITSVGVTQFAPDLAREVAEPIAEKAGYVYGRDWVNSGYKPPGANVGVVIDQLCRDFRSLYTSDARGKAAESLPLMEELRGRPGATSASKLHLIYCVTYCPPTEWISFGQGQHKVPVAFGCMSIMAPGYATFLDSGQLCGMLAGNRGAAEYEALVGRPGLGSRLVTASSLGNCFIILAILLGNLGLWAARRASQAAGGRRDD